MITIIINYMAVGKTAGLDDAESVHVNQRNLRNFNVYHAHEAHDHRNTPKAKEEQQIVGQKKRSILPTSSMMNP